MQLRHGARLACDLTLRPLHPPCHVRSGHAFINQGIGGTTSTIFMACVEQLVPPVGAGQLPPMCLRPLVGGVPFNGSVQRAAAAPASPAAATPEGRLHQADVWLHQAANHPSLFGRFRPSGQDTDIVTLEFTYNDERDGGYTKPSRQAFEQLLRKLLRLPSRCEGRQTAVGKPGKGSQAGLCAAPPLGSTAAGAAAGRMRCTPAWSRCRPLPPMKLLAVNRIALVCDAVHGRAQMAQRGLERGAPQAPFPVKSRLPFAPVRAAAPPWCCCCCALTPGERHALHSLIWLFPPAASHASLLHCSPALVLLHHYAWGAAYGPGQGKGLYFFPPEQELTTFATVSAHLSLRCGVGWLVCSGRGRHFLPPRAGARKQLPR